MARNLRFSGNLIFSTPQAQSSTPLDEGQVLHALSAQGIAPDTNQRNAIQAILALLATRKQGSSTRFTHEKLLGVYCHGLPGRGKSLVMDTVYALAPCKKLRIHFHEFLRKIICLQVDSSSDEADTLVSGSRAWLDGIELLCFDEFHVHDIADAFLVGRFLDTALKMGIRVVLTSNYAPDDLLPDPLYHSRFQPTIERIKRHFNVIHFGGDKDYRFAAKPATELRFLSQINEAADMQLQTVYARFEQTPFRPIAPDSTTQLKVAGRALQARAAGSVMLWADLDELCVEKRSHLDYLELAERWQGLIIGPLQTDRLKKPDTLQRLVWLVDILYDHKRMLFIASDRPLVDALSGLNGVHDLSRTLSRLAEMQSGDYGILQKPDSQSTTGQ